MGYLFATLEDVCVYIMFARNCMTAMGLGGNLPGTCCWTKFLTLADDLCSYAQGRKSVELGRKIEHWLRCSTYKLCQITIEKCL